METAINDFETSATSNFFDNFSFNAEMSFNNPGGDDDDEDDDEEEESQGDDDNPPLDDEVVHSPLPTQTGKPK